MARQILIHIRRPQQSDVTRFLDAWPVVFDRFGLTCRVASDEPAALEVIDVGSCANGPSPDLEHQFQRLKPPAMSGDDLVVLFAGRLAGASRNGCSMHPAGVRGVAISCAATNGMALPHEVLHLFVGPGHDARNAYLMYHDTEQLTSPEPSLTPEQEAALERGLFLDELGPAFETLAQPRVEAMTNRGGGRTRGRQAPRKTVTSRRAATKRRAQKEARPKKTHVAARKLAVKRRARSKRGRKTGHLSNKN